MIHQFQFLRKKVFLSQALQRTKTLMKTIYYDFACSKKQTAVPSYYRRRLQFGWVVYRPLNSRAANLGRAKLLNKFQLDVNKIRASAFWLLISSILERLLDRKTFLNKKTLRVGFRNSVSVLETACRFWKQRVGFRNSMSVLETACRF